MQLVVRLSNYTFSYVKQLMCGGKDVRLLIATLFLLGAGCQPSSENIFTTSTEANYQPGDDIRWAQPDWDDTNWPQSPILDLPDEPRLFWIRLDMPVHEVETLGLSIAGVVAREVYWDGILIGQSGRVGTDFNSEQVGPIDTTFRIPDSLASPGQHTIAVRVSSFRRPQSTSGLLMKFTSGEYRELTAASLRSAGIPLLFLGGFMLVALYYGVLYFADRRRLPYLFTSMLCLAVAALLIAESLRTTIGYTYDLHAVRLGFIELLTTIVGVLLATTFAIQFELHRRWVLAGMLIIAAGVALLLIEDHETGTYAVFAISLATALGVTAWAFRDRKPGASMALTGVTICFGVLLLTGHDFMDGAFFPAFGILIAGLLISVGLQTREQRDRHARALATTARLETELLKKHLQPHFLMNTLTSVLEWIETNPKLGARAIEALAAELRTLTEVSGEQLIPMSRELALCRAHLEVMGYRQAVQFELETTGVDTEAPIPPAVIHTLIENAITHNAYPPGKITFTLSETNADHQRQLILSTPLAGASREPRQEGGGLRYVRARLEEAMPGRWTLRSSEEADKWVTHIEISERRQA